MASESSESVSCFPRGKEGGGRRMSYLRIQLNAGGSQTCFPYPPHATLPRSPHDAHAKNTHTPYYKTANIRTGIYVYRDEMRAEMSGPLSSIGRQGERRGRKGAPPSASSITMERSNCGNSVLVIACLCGSGLLVPCCGTAVGITVTVP